MYRKIFIILLMTSFFYAGESYTFIKTKECEIPIKKSMVKAEDYRYVSRITDNNNLESKSTLYVVDAKTVSSKSVQTQRYSKHIVKYGFVLYYKDKSFTEAEWSESLKIDPYIIKLGKTILAGSIYEEQYINYLMEYCHEHPTLTPNH